MALEEEESGFRGRKDASKAASRCRLGGMRRGTVTSLLLLWEEKG